MKRTLKNFTAAEKMVLLRRHLVEKVPVSTVCDEAKLQPTVFYRWLKQLLENGAAALERSIGTPERPDRQAQRRRRAPREPRAHQRCGAGRVDGGTCRANKSLGEP